MKKIFIILSIACLFFFTAYADVLLENDVTVDSVKSTAMGGFHSGLADDVDILFSNPAGFLAVDEQMRLTQISLGLHGPVFDITNMVIQAIDGGTDPQDIVSEEENLALLRSLYAGASTSGPLSFSYIGNGIGFGFFNSSGLHFESPVPLEATAQIWEQLVLIGGYAFEIPIGTEMHSFEAGISLKGFFRGEEKFSTTYLQLVNLLSNPDKEFLVNQPFDLVTGIGFDIGLRYTFADILTVGLVGQDIYTPTVRNSYSSLEGFLDGADATGSKNGIVPMKINTGITVVPPLGVLENYVSHISFSLDYNDIFDFLMYPEIADNPILHVGTGAEVTILDILSIRGGMNEGLFAAGLGVKLGIADIGLSMYGTEVSHEPGLNPVYNLLFSIDLEV